MTADAKQRTALKILGRSPSGGSSPIHHSNSRGLMDEERRASVDARYWHFSEVSWRPSFIRLEN
jgi:hypothetical protein